MRVLVVNEPELAEAIDRLRGEWAERFAGELNTSHTAWEDVAASKQLDADVIVFPSRYLGELCSRGWLRPVRPNVLASEELQTADFFPGARGRLIQWGNETMALPLGVDPTGILQRASAPAALKLLELAAPQLISPARLGELFDTQSMRPQIVQQPFIDALTRHITGDDDLPAGRAKDVRTIPVLGYSDRLIAVASASRNAASAFKLVTWLAGPDASTDLARAGNGTLPARRSLANSASWYDLALSAGERAEQGKKLEAALSEGGCLLLPRIPGVDEYLAALDDAISAASSGAAPIVALEEAAQRWDAITDARGRDAQRTAYLKHLGME